MFIQNNLKINVGFNIQNTSIVNLISSFFLGILVSLNFLNNSILLLFYIGFLGCFSTFSSFIYQLFVLFQQRKFLSLFLPYIEVIGLSFLFFYLGYFLVKFFCINNLNIKPRVLLTKTILIDLISKIYIFIQPFVILFGSSNNLLEANSTRTQISPSLTFQLRSTDKVVPISRINNSLE